MARVAALGVALAGALIWALATIAPPAPRGADAPPAIFSAARAFVDINAIARAPRPVGSAENARVRSYLAARLKSLGADVSEQPVPIAGKSLERLSKWSGHAENGVVGHNVIGVIPGLDRAKPAVLLMAHHDGVWASPAAADDAMAVAAALETARALRIRGPMRRDLILLFTDGEEVGLDGAEAFFRDHPLARRTGMIINMESRGAGGRANMFETGPDNGAQMRLYADTVDRPATSSLAILIYDLMPNSTDYKIAKQHGIPGFNIAVLDRAWTYHSPLATPQSVEPASVQDMGDQALALASAMVFAAELPPRAPNAAFADLLGRVTIVYPATAGWAILLLAAALIGAALWRKRPATDSIVGGVTVTMAMLLYGALLLTTVNAVSGSGGAHYNYYDRLAALPRLELIAALLVAALLMLLPSFRRPPDKRLIVIVTAMTLMWVGLLTGGPLIALVVEALLAMAAAWLLPASTRDRGEGAAILLLLAAAIVQVAEPTTALLLQWPLLLGALAMAGRAFLPASAALIIATVCAVIGLGHLLGQAHFIFLGVGAPMPALMIGLLFAALPLILPLWPDRIPHWMPAVALVAAVTLALWVRLDPMAPSVPPYSLHSGDKTRT